MSGRGPGRERRSLEQRVHAAAPLPEADQAADSAADRACWVRDPPGHPGRFPGVVRRWHRHPVSGDWWAQVTYDIGSPPVVEERWLPATFVTPRDG